MTRFISIKSINDPTAQSIRAKYCESFLCRLKGLMFHKDLEPQEGLLLVQTKDSRMDSSIHMFFVWFDLGVVWINADMTVVDTIIAKAWRPAYFPKAPAKFVLEIRPEKLESFRTGDKVTWEDV
jgi:uncharacterized membrane protein (UPF0127 family)